MSLHSFVKAVDEGVDDVVATEQTVQTIAHAFEAVPEGARGFLLLLTGGDDLRVGLVQLVGRGVLLQ